MEPEFPDTQISQKGHPLIDYLLESGIIGVHNRRVIIDCMAGQPIRIYTDTFADSRLSAIVGPLREIAVNPGADQCPEFCCKLPSGHAGDHEFEQKDVGTFGKPFPE